MRIRMLLAALALGWMSAQGAVAADDGFYPYGGSSYQDHHRGPYDGYDYSQRSGVRFQVLGSPYRSSIDGYGYQGHHNYQRDHNRGQQRRSLRRGQRGRSSSNSVLHNVSDAITGQHRY